MVIFIGVMVRVLYFRVFLKSSDMNIQSNHCLECDEIMIGRIDKKFCSDSCRSSYNNRKRVINQTNVKKVNLILVKNRSILYELNTRVQENSVITTFQLKLMGFDFAFFTHQTSDRRGRMLYYCYDLGYQQLSGNKVKIVKNG
ncbi:MAG: hypothetical protein RL092_1891 [Bacteroidota bacterium]